VTQDGSERSSGVGWSELPVRDLPGFVPVDWREHRYVQVDGEEPASQGWLAAFLDDAAGAPLPASGGCTEERVLLRTPDGRVFAGLSYRGDIEGWRAYVGTAAGVRSALVARIDGAWFVLNDGDCCSLEDCDRVRV